MADYVKTNYQITHLHLHRFKDCKKYMPVVEKKRGILVEAIEAPVKKGSPIKKLKLKFVDSMMKFFLGWNEPTEEAKEFWLDKIKTINSYDDSQAMDLDFELSEYDGNTRKKLITGFPVLPDQKN